MSKPKFKVDDEVIISDKTFRFGNNPINWYRLKVGDTVRINTIYTFDQLHPEERIHANSNSFAYDMEVTGAVFWESDLEFKNTTPVNKTILDEITKRIKILENRFHIDIKWSATKHKRSL